MKSHLRKALAAVLLIPLASCLEGRDAVASPAERARVLERLAALQAERPAVVPETGIKDPFNPPPNDLREDYDPNAVQKPNAPARSVAGPELLAVLAAKLHPTGSVSLGGEPYLLFNEKRQKSGDKIIVTHEGVDYSLEILSIESNRFRVRYNDQELTRPIKN